MTELTHARLKELLHYDPNTGVFKWISKTHHRMKLREIAGYKDMYGYIVIRIFGKPYKAHRLAWFYMTGGWPTQVLDHINRKRDDNRIENLRLSTPSGNARNRGMSVLNKSGITGVCWVKSRNVWDAKIIKNTIIYRLGRFKTKEEAIAARRAAKKKLETDEF